MRGSQVRILFPAPSDFITLRLILHISQKQDKNRGSTTSRFWKHQQTKIVTVATQAFMPSESCFRHHENIKNTGKHRYFLYSFIFRITPFIHWAIGAIGAQGFTGITTMQDHYMIYNRMIFLWDYFD